MYVCMVCKGYSSNTNDWRKLEIAVGFSSTETQYEKREND